MSSLKQVAYILDVDEEDLVSAILMTTDRPKVTLTVRGPLPGGHGHYGIRKGSTMWLVAEELDIEPEQIRDAILAVKQPAPGMTATITVKARPD